MSWGVLIRAISGFYERHGERGSGAALVRKARAALADCERRPPVPMPTASLPVARHLDVLSRYELPEAVGAVVAAILAVRGDADWQQNPSYTRATVGGHFVDNYGYLEVVGPGRRYHCPDTRIGVLMLGPGVDYAEHAHPAEEVYHPIAGGALWWRDGVDWHAFPVAAAIHHAPWVRHAMRTGAEPLLALYCWGGEIGPAARLTNNGKAG